MKITEPPLRTALHLMGSIALRIGVGLSLICGAVVGATWVVGCSAVGHRALFTYEGGEFRLLLLPTSAQIDNEPARARWLAARRAEADEATKMSVRVAASKTASETSDHVSELTRALDSLVASPPPPPRTGWSFHYFWGLTLFCLLPFIWAVRKFRRHPSAGHCDGCGYDLRGNASGACPECGRPLASFPVVFTE
jgi:hypothetical protein